MGIEKQMLTNEQDYRFGKIVTIAVLIAFVVAMFFLFDHYQMNYTDHVANATGYIAALIVLPSLLACILATAVSKLLKLSLFQTLFIAFLTTLAAVGHVTYTILAEIFF